MDQAPELTFIDMDTFLSTFYIADARRHRTGLFWPNDELRIYGSFELHLHNNDHLPHRQEGQEPPCRFLAFLPS